MLTTVLAAIAGLIAVFTAASRLPQSLAVLIRAVVPVIAAWREMRAACRRRPDRRPYPRACGCPAPQAVDAASPAGGSWDEDLITQGRMPAQAPQPVDDGRRSPLSGGVRSPGARG